MRQTIIVSLCLLATLSAAAGKTPEGRWAGSVAIPGRDLQLVVDLAQDSTGVWIGSIIMPGLGIKGAAASNVLASDTGFAFDVDRPLRTAADAPAKFKAQLTADGRLRGEMSQGGNVAAFDLERIGAAQVEVPQRSTSVSRAVEDQWLGEFELGGYPRHVTITFANQAGAAATARFIIVGKQTTDVPIDLVVEVGDLLRIESQANHVAFEGRFSSKSDEIKGTVELGTLEVPMVLRRSARRSS
jgi:hypothetical protein